MRVFDIPICIDDPRCLLEDLLDLLRHVELSGHVRAIDFCDQSLDDGRSRRHLTDLDAGTEGECELDQFGAHTFGDLVALHAALLDGQQIDLDVSLIRLVAQVVVAHEAIEVVRAGEPRVGLVVGDLGLLGEVVPEELRHALRLLQRCSVGHVDDDLELALVIEGKHLHLDEFERYQCRGSKQQKDHSGEEHITVAR